MPTSSSDSEGTSERPRRRSSTRTTTSTRRPSTKSRRVTSEKPEVPAPAVADDDFGSGVENEARSPRPAREKRSSAATEPAPAAEESPSSERPARTRGGRTVRRSPRNSSDAPVDPIPSTSDIDRTERTSSRLERKIADVEPQTGMRYFSTDELDFGDDDVAPPPAPRESTPSRNSAPRGRSRDRNDVGSDRQPDFERDLENDRDFSDDRDDFGDDIEGEEGTRSDADGGGQPRQGELFDGDRRPRRRRRRRRRGSDGPVGNDSAPGGDGPARPENQGRYDSPRRNDGPDSPRRNDGPDNLRRNDGPDSPRRNDGPDTSRRNDGPGRGEPARFQGGGRVEGNRGGRSDNNRNDGGRGRRGGGRNDSGRNDSGRGRRNDGGVPRGGRDSGRGRDQGLARRGRTIQPSTEVVEGTFEGVLELHPRGYGFLRDPKRNYAAEDSNPFVSSSLVEKYGLRQGVLIRGDVGQGSRNQGPRLRDVEMIDGFTLEEYANVKYFDNLTAINPFEQIKLEIGPRPLTMRVMDLLCPIGKGQRALLVAPPRTGKTMLLQDIANSVSINHPEIHLIVLLIDERPEEVTEMRRNVKGEVISSSLDSDVESHIRLSELIIERAKRLAEEGKDVFVLLDSITRLARAFNKASSSGRTATGGLDIRALDVPKKLFGQARRFDEGGSLTVCGTALIDTGGRMDEAIFQEFKGTGNMEMVLSRELADRRIWPSIDISKSGTRREEKILAPDLLEGITMLRRSLVSLNPVEAMEQLTRTMEKFPTNREFLTRIKAVL